MADVASLETFVAVARLGSLQRASGRLHRTQPSLSARLATLEASWGTRLFRRHARGMIPTPEGLRLLPLAEAALAAVRAVDRAAGSAGTEGGELRVGSGDALGRDVVPETLSKLLGVQPELPVRLLEGSATRLLEALRAGEIDVALVAERAASPPPAGVTLEPLLASPVELLVPPGEPRSERAMPLRVLGGRRIVALQRGSAFRRHLEDAFAAARVPFRPAVEVGNLSLVRRFVAAGLGVAPVPSVAFAGSAGMPATGRRPVAGIPAITYVVARREGVPLGAEARSFLGLLKINNNK